MKICPICWKEFKAKGKQKYCSEKCYNFANNQKAKNKQLSLFCSWCWKEFIWNWRAKYCSKKCRYKYGGINISKTMSSEENKQKYINTCRAKYNVDNISQLPEVKAKKVATTRKHFWVDYSFQSEELRQKSKETNLKKRWVVSPMQDEKVKEKHRATCLQRLWVENVSQSEEVQKKKEETCMAHFWERHACLTPQCKEASNSNSKINKQFRQRLRDNGVDCPEKEFPLDWLSYDAIVWDTLIELDPSISHTSTPWILYDAKDKNYQKNKTIIANKNWYRCVHIFDRDDKEKILYMLKEKKKVWARQCEVREITYGIANEFLCLYHLQNNTRKLKTTIYFWLYYNDELVMVMSFWKPRRDKTYEYEILRLCSAPDYNILWWASKMLTYFKNKYSPNSIVSYCDLSKFEWKVYEQLWMTLSGVAYPRRHRRYKWLKSEDKKTLSQQSWVKIIKPPQAARHFTDVEVMKDRGFDQLVWKYFGIFGKWTKNDELMRSVWYIEVYDCWQAKYVRHKEKEEK